MSDDDTVTCAGCGAEIDPMDTYELAGSYYCEACRPLDEHDE